MPRRCKYRAAASSPIRPRLSLASVMSFTVLFDAGKATPVTDTRAMQGHRIAVLLTAITLVAGETVLREKPVVGEHDAIPHDFGDHRCRSNRKGTGITLLQSLLLYTQGNGSNAVDQEEIGSDRQAHHGARHPQQGRLEDIDPVNFIGPADTDT